MVEAVDFQVEKNKIDQLNKKAWEERVKDSTQAHVLSKEAFDLAESIDYSRGKAEGYRTFAFSLIRLSKHPEAIEYLDKALVLFETLNDLEGQGSVYGYYGMIQRSLGNYDASLMHLFKFLAFARQSGNLEAECGSYYHLGVTYKYSGDNEKALDYLLQSLAITQSEFWTKPYCLRQIGLIYFETGDFNKALDYDRQSLALVQQGGDKWGEAGCLDNIGFIYFKLKDYDKALNFCLQALSISRLIDDKKGQSNALFHLGNIYKELAEYDKASEYCAGCLIIRREIGDKTGEAEVLLFLASLYIKPNFTWESSQHAFELLDKAMQLSEETKAMDLIAKIHLGYYEVSRHFNHYQEALKHLETYMRLSRKMESDIVNEKIKNLDISLKAAETDKKLLSALQEIQQIAEEERSRLAKDLHDGLGSLLSGIKLTLNSMKGNLVVSGENAVTFTKVLGQLDTTIMEMRRVAHNMMPEALLKFGLDEAMHDFCDSINESNTVKMRYIQLGLRQPFEKSTEVILYRIVQELSNNAIKHAMAKSILIQLTKHERGISLTVEDDGNGFDSTQISALKGDGLKNVQSRVDYLKGTLNIESEKGNGTSITIEIPY